MPQISLGYASAKSGAPLGLRLFAGRLLMRLRIAADSCIGSALCAIPMGPEAAVLRPKRTVLIADDDAIARTVASELVGSWGFDCVAVPDGEAALLRLQQEQPPTIAILDWLMPKLTGTEVCSRIRASNPRQYIYFILLSARDAREDAIAGLRSGADAYMNKPLDAEEFRAKLDIAERILQMEESLRDAHTETELFVNSVPSILIGTDKTGEITRWNHEAHKTFGVDAASAIGRALRDSGVSWQNHDICQQVLEVLDTGSTVRLNAAFEKQGMQRLVGLTIHPLRTHVGTIAGSVIIGSDITDKKLMEEQLRQSQKLEAIGQLAAGIAHEINTPTQFVSDNVTFLKESWTGLAGLFASARRLASGGGVSALPSDELFQFESLAEKVDLEYYLHEIPKALDETLDGLQRISKIVRAIKEFSHPSSEEARPIDLNAAIQTTITVSRNEWKYVASLETDFDPDLPLVPCIADHFNQAMLNIIVNAAHAIEEVVGDGKGGKGRILIRTRRDGDGVEIAVSDTGIGIHEEIRSRIFEPFFSTKQVGKGTGQGLGLTHAIVVKEHGGRIWFETDRGSGTTFFIRLPLTPPVGNSPDQKGTVPGAARAVSSQ